MENLYGCLFKEATVYLYKFFLIADCNQQNKEMIYLGFI
jgi:hypothetical protein